MAMLTQWVLLRRAMLPKNFQAMVLLTEYVAGNEVVQTFMEDTEKGHKFYAITTLNDIPIRVAQIGLMTSVKDGIVTEWAKGKGVPKEIKEAMDIACTCTFESGNDFLWSWRRVGDDYKGGFQLDTVAEFEAFQRDLALQKGDDRLQQSEYDPYLHPDTTARFEWFYGTGKTVQLPDDDENVEVGDLSAFTDVLDELENEDKED